RAQRPGGDGGGGRAEQLQPVERQQRDLTDHARHHRPDRVAPEDARERPAQETSDPVHDAAGSQPSGTRKTPRMDCPNGIGRTRSSTRVTGTRTRSYRPTAPALGEPALPSFTAAHQAIPPSRLTGRDSSTSSPARSAASRSVAGV